MLGRISKLRAYWWAIGPTQLCFLNRWSPEAYLKKVGNISLDGTEVIGRRGNLKARLAF